MTVAVRPAKAARMMLISSGEIGKAMSRRYVTVMAIVSPPIVPKAVVVTFSLASL